MNELVMETRNATAGFAVEWAQNPLASKILLNDVGRLRLKLGIAVDTISSCHALLSLARDEQDLKWCDRSKLEQRDDESIEAFINRQAVNYETYLQEVHCGDCTCVPVSCMKCHAEDMLGFSVTEGLGKYEGHAVQSAFGKDRTTIEAAIAYLRGPITAGWGEPADWAPYVERWRQEQDRAIQWLQAHQQKFL